MMRMALIANDGLVANVALFDPGAQPHAVEGHSWADVPSHVGPGWRTVNGAWQPPAPAPAEQPSDPTLAAMAAEIATLKAALASLVQAAQQP